MATFERLLQSLGVVAIVCGVVVGSYGYLLADVDVVAMLAGVFVVVVGATLVAAGAVLPRLEANGRRL